MHDHDVFTVLALSLVAVRAFIGEVEGIWLTPHMNGTKFSLLDMLPTNCEVTTLALDDVCAHLITQGTSSLLVRVYHAAFLEGTVSFASLWIQHFYLAAHFSETLQAKMEATFLAFELGLFFTPVTFLLALVSEDPVLGPTELWMSEGKTLQTTAYVALPAVSNHQSLVFIFTPFLATFRASVCKLEKIGLAPFVFGTQLLLFHMVSTDRVEALLTLKGLFEIIAAKFAVSLLV